MPPTLSNIHFQERMEEVGSRRQFRRVKALWQPDPVTYRTGKFPVDIHNQGLFFQSKGREFRTHGEMTGTDE